MHYCRENDYQVVWCLKKMKGGRGYGWLEGTAEWLSDTTWAVRKPKRNTKKKKIGSIAHMRQGVWTIGNFLESPGCNQWLLVHGVSWESFMNLKLVKSNYQVPRLNINPISRPREAYSRPEGRRQSETTAANRLSTLTKVPLLVCRRDAALFRIIKRS